MCLPGHRRLCGRTWGQICPACLGGFWGGEGEEGEGPRAVVAWIASESRTALGPSTDLPRDTSFRIAQRISCTLHQENARAILRRSPGSVSGSCCCVSFPPVPVSVCPPFCVCCLSLCRSVACSGSFCLFFRLCRWIVMCLRPSLLAWRYCYFVLYTV